MVNIFLTVDVRPWGKQKERALVKSNVWGWHEQAPALHLILRLREYLGSFNDLTIAIAN